MNGYYNNLMTVTGLICFIFGTALLAVMFCGVTIFKTINKASVNT